MLCVIHIVVLAVVCEHFRYMPVLGGCGQCGIKGRHSSEVASCCSVKWQFW